MHKIALLSIAALASLAGAAIAQTPEPEPAWRASALALVPAGYVAGDAYRTDEAAQTGYLAIYPANANDPKSSFSVLAPRQALVVKLAKGDGGLLAMSAELKPRAGDGDDEDFTKLHAELTQKRAALPNGTEPCDLGAWSEDRDPNGLNVRAEPSVKARVLGTLPPPYRLKMGGSENTPEGGWLTEFRIIGFKDGWFLIEGATPPGKKYEDEKKYPRSAPKPYGGRGRVAANKVGASYALHRCEVEAGRSQARRTARHRRRTETPARLQRVLGTGGKRGRHPRLVARPVLQPGDELKLRQSPARRPTNAARTKSASAGRACPAAVIPHCLQVRARQSPRHKRPGRRHASHRCRSAFW